MTNELDRALAAQRAPYPGSTTVRFASLAARLATRRRTVDRRYPPPPADRSQRAQLAFVDQLTEACAAQCEIDLAPDLFRRQGESFFSVHALDSNMTY